MSQAMTASVVPQIESLFDGGSILGLSDRQLLERFLAHSEPTAQAAFAALVARHGPMVLGLCRQLLGDHQLAEDAFQAVFFVLARRARSIHDPDLLANWLYGVAIRTARKAKARLARERRKEAEPMATGSSAVFSMLPVDEAILRREQAAVLHQEIDRLPRLFRVPLVLCYFEGLTLDEAAHRLRCPAGTIHSRLARARRKLRRGLTGRGVSPSIVALVTAPGARSAPVPVSTLLCDTTNRAAAQFAAGEAVKGASSTVAMAMAEEVLRSTPLISVVKLAVLTFLFLGTVATFAGFVGQPAARQDEKQAVRPLAARADDDIPKPASGGMFVTGSVLDSEGKPWAVAPIELIGRRRQPWVSTSDPATYYLLLGRGLSDGQGRFRVEAVRTSTDRFFEIHALVAVTGMGLGWHAINPDAGQPAAELRVLPEQVIHGKLVDVNGQPAAGVELRIMSIGRRNNATGVYDGINMGNSQPPEGLRNWPKPMATDAQGRFRLHGVGPTVEVSCQIRDDRFAVQTIRLRTDNSPNEVTVALQPATIVHGRVLAADNGQPIPHAVVEVASSQKEFLLMGGPKFRADDRGRYTANVAPGTFYRVQAFPPEGAPYLITKHEFTWTKGTVKVAVDIKVPRGVVIRGKVTEDGTARSLAGASVQYIASRRTEGVTGGWQAVVASKDDGTYQIVVPPGRGHLFFYGPTSDYVLQVIGGHVLRSGKPGGERYYAHTIIPYDVNAGDPPHEVVAALRPGKTVKGRVVGPEGQPIDHAKIISTLHFNYFHLNWRGDLARQTSEGLFELHGVDPEKTTRVSFLDADHQWGATVELSGKQASDEVMIRLQPCGQARARFVGPDGKPVVNIFPQFEILGTPGPHEESQDKNEQTMLAADAAYMPNVDRKHYWKGPFTDAGGRILLPDLIPGALYRISDTSGRPQKGAETRKEFTVKPGETLDLGDILIENPPPPA